MTYFEIDPTVLRLVEGPTHFTYVTRAREQGAQIDFVMGDARLSLERTDRQWGLMLVDAFSSDSIPAHLLTREAVQLYLDRLSDDGILLLHISNRYLRLEPVVERIADALGAHALVMHDYITFDLYRDKPEVSGKLSSTWVVVSRKKDTLAPFVADGRWKPLDGDPAVGLWTDDYTPILDVLQGEWNLFGGK
jgi:spermidine synthase